VANPVIKTAVSSEVVEKDIPSLEHSDVWKGSPMSDKAKITVLHVDDYAAARYTVRRILSQAGFHVLQAANGAEALRQAAKCPHLIILDVNLPDLSGLDVCRRLKTNPLTASIPVLHLSATYVDSNDRLRGLSTGADGYLTEPIEPAELLAMVHVMLRWREQVQTLQQQVLDLQRTLAELGSNPRHVPTPEDALLVDLAHEFRTPLNAILALARLLEARTDGELTTEQERQVMLIRQSAEALLDLVREVLLLTAVETGEERVRAREFTLDETFRILEGTLVPLLHDPALRLVFEPPPDIPPLYTDQTKLLQILRNLVCNAIKFTGQGEVRVSALLAPAGDTVTLTVRDTGLGIAPQDQERIFRKFVRLQGPLREWRRGVGIGLPLAKELAHLLNGDITLQSTLGMGSTFSVTIPCVYRPPG
jgi:signal transduction histidine kinase